jgi:hypothetical protein
MRKSVYVCMIGILLFLLGCEGAFGDIPNVEREALEQLYKFVNGDHWINSKNWNNRPVIESEWFGITCDVSRQTVLKIELSGNKLSGPLPYAMGNLSNLTDLDLSNNNLNGKIPNWIEKYRNLKILNLSNNNFSGEIPRWLGNLSKLEKLYLDSNSFEGSIPAELAKLSNLKVLRIGSNRIIGKIPDDLSTLGALKNNKSNFKWNGLYSDNALVKEFLAQKQEGGNWEDTQTVPPRNIVIKNITDKSLTICWEPIPFKNENGGYRIFFNEDIDSFKEGQSLITANKRVTEVTIPMLKEKTNYYLKIVSRTDKHDNNKNRIESIDSQVQKTATGGILISGTVIDKKDDGKGVAGIEITTSPGSFKSETNKDGVFQISVPLEWKGTVYPICEGYVFTPSAYNIDTLSKDSVSGKDFSRECNTYIAGKVTHEGKGVRNVSLIFISDNGKGEWGVVTDESGVYKTEVPFDWSGTVKPEKDDHSFFPVEIKYPKINQPTINQDYQVKFKKIISGYVSNIWGKKGKSDIILRFSNIDPKTKPYLEDTAKTDLNGYFEKGLPDSWTGNFSPESKSIKYYFSPGERKFLDYNKNYNFRAIKVLKSSIEFGLHQTETIIGKSQYVSTYKFIYPEFRYVFRFTRTVNLWSSLTLSLKNLSSTNNDGDLLHMRLKQQIGLGLRIPNGGSREHVYDLKLEYFLNCGLEFFSYKEGKNLEAQKNYNVLGIVGNFKVILYLSDRFFLDLIGEISVGGTYSCLKIGICTGYRF